MGNYQLAEQLYRLNPSRDWYQSSSAVWRLSDHRETDRERVGRTSAVETVYGRGGIEMARRLEFLGNNLSLTYSTDDHEMDRLYSEAQSLYHRHGQHGRCAELLIERCVEDYRDSQPHIPLLKQALNELSSDHRIAREWLPGIGQMSAKQAKEFDLAQRYRVCDLKCQAALADEGNPIGEFWAHAKIILFVICVAVSAGLFTRMRAEVGVDRAYTRLQRSITCSLDGPGSVAVYNQLIDLDLHKRDFDSALRNSADLLRHLGVVVVDNACLTKPYSPLRRWLSVALDEVTAAGLVVMVSLILWNL